MRNNQIVSKINEYLYLAAQELCAWLNKMLPQVSAQWWQECVLPHLSYAQLAKAQEKHYTSLEQFDLAALLRIADKSWYAMRTFAYLPNSDRQCVRELMKVRNNWAHFSDDTFDKDLIVHDLGIIQDFFELVIKTTQYSEEISRFISEVQSKVSSAKPRDAVPAEASRSEQERESAWDSAIRERDIVYLTGSPDTKGMVCSISDINGTKRYEVFVGGELRTFFEGQIVKEGAAEAWHWDDISTFLSNLTAHELNNPSSGNLYSLNSARIDFVPYQFRPALKLIKADEPRLLIADSVGVGKTIEAGLIIKELEARSELHNILIICPKPLVAERKWELEMKRFDEEFFQVDRKTLQHILSDTHRDGEWPEKYSKAIVPYSAFDSEIYQGSGRRRGRKFGLLDLDPPPHFDLVIIDEAHQIRNGSMKMDKAFAYKCVHYFCEHANAVVMLTATPLQTKDDDLYTLLNLLRPDVVMDKEVFHLMSRPNEFVSQAARFVRGGAPDWQEQAAEALRKVTSTQWGDSVISKSPLYASVLQRLEAGELSQEERVKLIFDIESLHSFNSMINRTRRKDIQDFCVRRSYTIETQFTPRQQSLHDELLRFEQETLSAMHGISVVPFIMSTLKRQAASCIFGMAPCIRDIVNRRFSQLTDDPEADVDDEELTESAAGSFLALAQRVIQLADNLPEEDPKFESVVEIINRKQRETNNKVILFSTYRNTLNYIRRKLEALDFRVAQVDGSVPDDLRLELRERFALDREDPQAIDIMLFTEIGSEGLDYQFCDTMINYDLPWNPMRLEQRIGRIDRRGQKSEAVNIYNLITSDTLDADIYERCLLRIGIFERSVGECEEVLGAIGAKIEKIASAPSLTPEERRRKLQQMADNEVRKMQELARLEDEEKALFGFDLSNYTTAEAIREAESPWLAPQNIQVLVERYLDDLLGKGEYILGSSVLKQLRLNADARAKLREESRRLPAVRSALMRNWDQYLKGSEAMRSITFVSEAASAHTKALFITPAHPLVKLAARHFASQQVSHIHLEYHTEAVPPGHYPFSIYAWDYMGISSSFKVVTICENDQIANHLLSIIQEARCIDSGAKAGSEVWAPLEALHLKRWQDEKSHYCAEVQSVADYKLESIGSNFRNRKRALEQKIQDNPNEKIRTMLQSELNSASEHYQCRVADIKARTSRADIHTKLIASGIIDIYS